MEFHVFFNHPFSSDPISPLVPQVYQPFFADFGPLNLGQAFRFCQKLRAALKVRRSGCCVFLIPIGIVAPARSLATVD